MIFIHCFFIFMLFLGELRFFFGVSFGETHQCYDVIAVHYKVRFF